MAFQQQLAFHVSLMTRSPSFYGGKELRYEALPPGCINHYSAPSTFPGPENDLHHIINKGVTGHHFGAEDITAHSRFQHSFN